MKDQILEDGAFWAAKWMSDFTTKKVRRTPSSVLSFNLQHINSLAELRDPDIPDFQLA